MLLKIIYLLISGHIGSLWLGSLSLAVESRGYSLAEVYGLPIVSVCPVAEHRRYSVKAELWLVGPRVLAQ